jgi:hypothetical protein
MVEDLFVEEALRAAQDVLGPPLLVRRGAALLYQVTVNNRLEVTVDPRRPMRGQSAFQIVLCVVEAVGADVEIPRVVMEFKPRLTTGSPRGSWTGRGASRSPTVARATWSSRGEAT